MRTRKTERTCPKCGRTFPVTAQYWYLYQTGPRRGRPTGYCRASGCQNRVCREYEATVVTGARLARRRLQQLAYQRRAQGYDPERYRGSKYEAVLAEAGS
jgi:hypothetical protein